MPSTQRNNIYIFLLDCLKHLNDYPFFQYDENSTLSYSTIRYRTKHLTEKKILELDLKKISVNVDKETIIDSPLFLNQLYIQNISYIENILGKPFSFNNISHDLLLSFYFNNEEENSTTLNNTFKYLNKFINITQVHNTDFIEIEINEEFKSGEEFYINIPKLKNEDHLVEIYYSTNNITLLPDSKHNTMIFRFKKKVDEFKFAFRISKYTSTNLLDAIKQRGNEKPRIYLNDKKTNFLLEKNEICDLKERKYKKVTLSNMEEMLLAIKNNQDYKKENFLYVNSFLSEDHIILNLLLEFADINSSTYHILCHIKEYNDKQSTLDLYKECDWVYYKDIFRIVENISTQFILNRSMSKIKTFTPWFLTEIKEMIENNKYEEKSKDWITTGILQFLEKYDLFLTAEDRLLYIRLDFLKSILYGSTPGPEKRIQDYFNKLDEKYIPFILLQVKDSIKSNKKQKIENGELEYIKLLTQILNNHFKEVTSNPFDFLLNYLNNLENPSGYKYSDVFKKNIEQPQVNENESSQKTEKTGDEIKTKNKLFYKKTMFIGFCVGSALIAVIGGAIYTLM